MAGSFRVEGANELRTLAAELKVADKALKNRMLRGLRAAAAPAKTVIPEHEREVLPKKGGLNEWVASAEVKVRTSTTGRGAGVRVTQGRNSQGRGGMSRSNLRLAEQQGKVRHPNRGGPGFSINRRDVPGNGWSDTDIPKDWFEGFTERALGPGAEVAMRKVLDETARAAGFRGP